MEFGMEEENNRSSVGGMEGGNSNPPAEDGGDDNQEAKFDENDAQRRVSEANCSNCTAEKTFSGEKAESRPPQSETLTSARVPESGFESYPQESSNFLLGTSAISLFVRREVPVVYSLQPLQSVENLKDEPRVIHKEPVKGITVQPAEVEIQPQLQLQLVESRNSHCLPVQDKQNSPDTKPLSTVSMLKTPDGYNWRKYGQKQVKSPEGSRSYYRCTFSDCHAKKIECCDRSNRVIETVYRSHHNHDPPQKVNCARENKHSLAIVPVNGTHETTHSGSCLNDSLPSTSSKEPLVAIDQIPEIKQQDSCGSDETTEINIKEEYINGPEYKRRQKRSSTGELDSHHKTGKKSKYVVHTAGDVCISSDGYRWRKYGQKMVKGNPHPRNYYRCTSAGCPVRKHIERAIDNDGAVVITYKGVHDHDMPVPRKRHGSKNAPLIAAVVKADNLQIEPHQSQTQQSVDKESESSGETLNPGGEKSSESTRTLLSFGFEIKPC